MKSHFLTVSIAILIGLSTSATLSTAEHGRLPADDWHLKRVEAFIEDSPQPDYHHPSDAAIEAFRDLKFGVRIHWGVYAMIGDASWPLLHMTNEERQSYQQKYKSFNPAGFNADEWMQLFQTNGVQVFAFTAKHHDGFSMFDTQTRVKQRVNWTAPGGPRIEDCDLAYSIMETPFRRDIVKELCDAGQRFGLKIDLYYSHPDWYDADFRPYAMNPLRTESTNTYGALPDEFDAKYTKNIFVAPDPTPEERERMMARHREQLVELLTRYGRIDMLCLDQWLGSNVWPELRETIKLVRKLQPDVMLRARGIGNYGDYYTPEGWIPGSKENTTMPWMVIYKLAGTWVYQPNLTKYKGTDWVVENLADITAKGGNFMVGIGPDDQGRFHPQVVQTLQETGAWLKVNGTAIFESRPRSGDLWREGEHIRFTRTKDNRFIHAISLRWPGELLILKTVSAKPGSQITLLGESTPLKWRNDPRRGLMIALPERLQNPENRPCRFAYAFQIEGHDRVVSAN
ncbi:MAG TPA: alpha-L-fucosidase [Verrucomicrobiae bacterium]|nr:alpha-L-fucosidase [Verrucomicrobiae bacterium]